MAARVLLVGAQASTLRAMLGPSGRGLAFETASVGQAVERAAAVSPDVIVMAGADPAAADTVAALADDPTTDALPVVVVGVGKAVERVVALGARVVPSSGIALRRAIDETLAMRVRLGGIRVLVADEDLSVARFFGDLLRDQGCEVVEALDGDAAFESALAATPDLVAAEALMPCLRGERLVRKMRDDAVLRDVPVVLLSSQKEWLARARESGVEASGYLAKGADTQTVLTCLRSVLATSKDLESRLGGPTTTRGRLDEVTPHRLIRMASRLRPDARVSARDGTSLYDVQLRGGSVLTATCVSREGEVRRGSLALDSLLRVRAGRFVVAAERGGVQAELGGSVETLLGSHVARLRAGVEAPVAVADSPRLPAPEALASPPPAPVQVTVRLPPIRRPAPLPALPPFVAPHVFPFAAQAYAPAPRAAERTLPLPNRPRAERVSAPPEPSMPLAQWMRTVRWGRTAAVVAVAIGGLALGVGLRVVHVNEASAESVDPPRSVEPPKTARRDR
jgi:CheY-like chemotaxis protein